MKTLTSILEKGDLTPRERIMLVIKNYAHLCRTGEYLFDESELHTVSNRWKPKDNYEVDEYNKYLHFWQDFRYLKADMQTLFLNAQVDNANIEKILSIYYYNKDINQYQDVLERRSNSDFEKPAFLYILENTGIEYELLLHTYTFLSLPEAVKKDVLLICDDSIDNYFYWGPEEKLASIMRDKKELSEDDISNLTNLVIDSIAWEDEEIFKDSSMVFARRIFSGYFGNLPFSYLGERMAYIYGIDLDDEELYEKLTKLPNLKNKLTRLLKEEIGDGLFTDYYVPLCNSDSRETYNGNTKLKHSTVMTHWLETKQKVTAEIQGYLDSGKFTLRTEVRNFSKIGISSTIITGAGLYYANDSLPFIKDYKAQVDKLMIYGYLFKMIAESSVYLHYSQLLYFDLVAEKVSQVFDEDVSDISKRYISAMQSAVETHNIYMRGVTSAIEDQIFECREYSFYLHSFLHTFSFDLFGIKPEMEKSLEIFDERAGENLGREWKALKNWKD